MSVAGVALVLGAAAVARAADAEAVVEVIAILAATLLLWLATRVRALTRHYAGPKPTVTDTAIAIAASLVIGAAATIVLDVATGRMDTEPSGSSVLVTLVILFELQLHIAVYLSERRRGS